MTSILEAVRPSIAFSIFLSPMLLILVALVASVVARHRRRLGFALTFGPLALAYVLSMPIAVDALSRSWEAGSADEDARAADAGAIAVLGGDVDHAGNAHERFRLGPISLARVYLAASTYRATRLPILVSGGRLGQGQPATADLMAAALTDVFAIAVRWRESDSTNTFENAEFSAPMLKQAGIGTILLVGQGRDMPRAVWSFGRFGIVAVPVAARGPDLSSGGIADFLPSARALETSRLLIHEILGMAYYRLVYGPGQRS